METLPASQALATQRVILSPSAWQVKTWRPWSAPQMQSGGVLGLGGSHQYPSLEGLLPRVLSSCTPPPRPGASEPRPAPPLPQVVLGNTGGAGARSWLLQLLLEQRPLWLHIRAELAAEKGESGAPGDRPAAARCGMLLQPREVAR